MGVRGLTTVANRYQAAISQVLEFPVASTSSTPQPNPTTTLCIDAWAWIYEVWGHHFGESAQGGNYADFIEFVKDAVSAWRACSLEPVFIWDGPEPLAKQPVYLERRAALAAGNSAFMRSSIASRSSRRFQLESYPSVPLIAQAVKSALVEEGVRSIVAQSEADGAVAEMADETAGLAASKDSDFFILCSRGSGRGNYTPVDSWEYIVEDVSRGKGEGAVDVHAEADQSFGITDEADGFEAVTSKRQRKRAAQLALSTSTRTTSLLPQNSIPHPPLRDSGSDLQLKSIRLRVYDPQKLAAQLRIPSALLPLLGAVVGNDYTTPSQEALLFRHLHFGAGRIREAAEVIQREWLRTIGGPVDSKQKNRASVASSSRSVQARLASKTLIGAVRDMDDDAHSVYSDHSSATATPMQMTSSISSLTDTYSPPLDPVRNLVSSVVSCLLERADVATHRSHYVSEADKEGCIESIIESMAAYSLLTNVSTTRSDDPAIFWSRTLPAEANGRVLDLYREAFSSGTFSEQMVSALASRVVVTTLAPEDPDQKTVHVGVTMEIRRWTYAILFGVWGMSWARDSMSEPVVNPEETDSRGEETPFLTKSLLGSKPTYKEGERPDDVISVETESESEGEREPCDDDDVSMSGSANGYDERDRDTDAPPLLKPPPAVREYVRKGDRLVGELVPIMELADLLAADIDSLPPSLNEVHAQYLAARSEGRQAIFSSHAPPTSDPMPPLAPLLPLRTRLDLYKHVLCSSGEMMSVVPLRLLPLAASLRRIIRSMAQEAGESKKRLSWTLPEVTSAILAGCHVAAVYSKRVDRHKCTTQQLLPRPSWIQPTSRAIHLASSLQLVLESANYLASSLLLNTTPSSSGDDAVLPSPHVVFDGPIFHLLLAHNGQRTEEMKISDETQKQAQEVLDAVLADGLREDLAISIEELKRLRKQSKKKAKALVAGEDQQQQQPAAAAARGHVESSEAIKSTNGKNAFELLMGQ